MQRKERKSQECRACIEIALKMELRIQEHMKNKWKPLEMKKMYLPDISSTCSAQGH
jgi:hypothetical protein